MAARLTFFAPNLTDPVADAMRDHIATLLEPVTYERLKPTDADVPHPVVAYDKELRAHLETRNRNDRETSAALAVAGYPLQGFQTSSWDIEDVA